MAMDASNYSDPDHNSDYYDLGNASDYIYDYSYDYYANNPYFVDVWSGEHIVAGMSIAVFAIPGLIAYITTVAVILRNPQTFAKKSYYTLLLSLAICDILQTFGCLCYAMPSILLQKRVYGELFDLIYGSVGCGMLYYVGLGSMVLIAINRYVAVCRFSVYKRIFQPSRMRFYLLGAWIFGILSAMCQLFPGFGYHIYPHWYAWGFDMEAWGNAYFLWYDRVATVILFLTLIFCYVSIIIKRPGKVTAVNANSLDNAAKSKRERAERVLALQFALISSVFMIYIIVNQLVIPNRFYSLFLTLYYIIFINCNPFIYFAFNSDIRQHVLKMLGKAKEVSVINVTSSGHTLHR